jgi:hypothetical protein
MSRPFVELHDNEKFSLMKYFRQSFRHQDDPTETIIIDRVFGDKETWNDPLWLESCPKCRGSEWLQGIFSNISRCPRDVATWSMNSVIAFHPFNSSDAAIAARMVGSLLANLCHYHQPKSQESFLCLRDPDDKQPLEPTVESIRLHAIHETIESVPAQARQADLGLPPRRRRWRC